MTNQNVAYYSWVNEYESGWGCRPDGYLVALTKEAFNQRAAQINSQTGHEFSRVDGPAKLCLVTDEMMTKLQETDVVWTSNKKDWLVEG